MLRTHLLAPVSQGSPVVRSRTALNSTAEYRWLDDPGAIARAFTTPAARALIHAVYASQTPGLLANGFTALSPSQLRRMNVFPGKVVSRYAPRRPISSVSARA